MSSFRTGFVTLMLVCAAYTSQSLESARDQYKAHEDVPHSPQPLSEATDRAVRQFFKVKSIGDDDSNKKAEVHDELQEPPSVKLRANSTTKKSPIKKSEESRNRRHIDFARGYNIHSNYFSTWNPARQSLIPIPPLSSFSVFQPSYYQLSRPYFIPVWGTHGRIPFYFPPQPIYINSGYPVHNPPTKPYLPPNNGYLPPDNGYLPPNNGYLPPDPNAPTNTTEMPTDTRFNDDRPPVWDQVANGRTTTSRPTRPPTRPGQRPATHPPLVHNDNEPSTTTSRPRPTQRPPSQENVPSTPSQPSGGRQPSRCVWAIISCCSTSSQEISYSCFEQLGCTGAFWDSSPCDSDFARAAIANVINYYNTK